MGVLSPWKFWMRPSIWDRLQGLLERDWALGKIPIGTLVRCEFLKINNEGHSQLFGHINDIVCFTTYMHEVTNFQLQVKIIIKKLHNWTLNDWMTDYDINHIGTFTLCGSAGPRGNISPTLSMGLIDCREINTIILLLQFEIQFLKAKCG